MRARRRRKICIPRDLPLSHTNVRLFAAENLAHSGAKNSTAGRCDPVPAQSVDANGGFEGEVSGMLGEDRRVYAWDTPATTSTLRSMVCQQPISRLLQASVWWRQSRSAHLHPPLTIIRPLQEVPLGEAEQAAVEDGVAAYEDLLSKLADVPTPAGPTPRQIGNELVQITTVRRTAMPLAQGVMHEFRDDVARDGDSMRTG